MELTDTAALQTSALRLLAEHFKVMRAIYYEADSDNDTFTLTAQFETETTAIPLQYRLSDFSPTVAEEYRTGRTQMVTDTENEPYAENYRKLGIRSWLATPFVDSGNVVTVIGLHCRTPRYWCSEDVRLLEYFAERLYAAVKRTRAEEALRESESRLAQDLADAKLLQQFSNDVIHLDELDEIYELLLHTAADLMQSDFASVQLYSEPTETLSLVAHKNFHPESVTFWTFVSVASGSVCGEALRRQFRILVEDVETEEFATNELKIFRLSGIRAVQSTPIMSSRGKLIGMLNTQWKQPKSFSEDQFRFFDVLVRQAAEVIDRKHAECLLRQSEEKYRDLFDSMDEGYCIIQILFNEENEPYDWIFLEVNPAFEKNNGLTNAVGKTILELTPNIEPKWFEIYGRVVTTGEPNRFEEDSPAFNRWFSLFAFRVGSPGEHTVAVLFNDITRRKKAEADLRKSEEQFRQAIQDAPIPIIMHAEDGEVLQLSRTWTELTGFTLADISNFDLWLSTAYGQGADEVRSHMRSLFDGTQRTITVDFPMSTLSGEIRHWSFSASSPGTLKDGRRFIVGMAVDITDRKNHEEHLENFSLLLEQQIKERTLELQESRDRLQSIFDTTLVGMSLFAPVRDASGEITDFRIVSVNKKIEDGSGRTDLVGKLYGELFPGIKQMGLFDLMVKTLETGNPGKMDYYYPYEGIERWYSTMFVKGDDILVSTNMDITERIQAEEKIKKMERDLQLEIFRTSLSTLEEERYRISESLHNGIAQILYGIKINMSGLTFDMPQQEFDEAKAYSSKLLTEAINENRRISHELMPLTLEQFGLKSAIDDACRQLTGATKFHCRVNGLYQRMEKYLELAVYRTAQELMTNVVKHANASDCYVTIVIRPKEISIIVSDNGQGMVAVKKRKPGIGLASIRSKIKLLNGDVRIDTGPGKGTTVKVLIPKPEQDNAD
ncbi:PAS domain S-box-containing protein [Arcticibacter pallidicorallinus]|uniref:histidine kinase n=1 Tax=Arcticibacter pallidicorallinus TaxID=1259464 RepID=A0A2T0U0V8_9SPHI|nr:GAF domain-containing protein [Arcticibacter pallidicorallinus]PRY51551.1 PAS domain S-box-containing protein [Arcticibacter pallidicorallinus]